MIEAARAAASAMAEKIRDPATYPWITYAWVIAWSCMGGAVNFYAKIRAGHARPFNLVEGLGELATSGFVGVMTFYLCEWAVIDPLLSAVFIGISGHMGSRAIFLAERMLQGYVERRTGLKVDQ